MCKNRAELPGFNMITKLKVASGGIRVQPEGDHEVLSTHVQEKFTFVLMMRAMWPHWLGRGCCVALPSICSNPTCFVPSQALRAQSCSTHPVTESLHY